MPEPGTAAIGTWSGGRYLRFGEAIDEERLEALLRPREGGIETVLTADAYGQGEADSLLGRAWRASRATGYALVGAMGHDFYEGERDGPKGFPRFTDPGLRDAGRVRRYLRMAAERSLERVGARTASTCCCSTTPTAPGYESEEVWDGMAALREAGWPRRSASRPAPRTASPSI